MEKTTEAKSFLFLLWLIIIHYPSANAQDAFTSGYLNKTGEYARIYSGEMERAYDNKQYENFPYYNNPDFTEGEIIYKTNSYPRQQVRLDLYKEQLIILSPKKQYRIIVNSEDVEQVKLYGKTFVRLVFPAKSELKSGYYIRLSEGKSMQLYCKEKYVQKERPQDRWMISSFQRQIRYYVRFNGQYYSVKNADSFIKLLPQYKAQINQFAKEHKSDSESKVDQYLTLLANYCEQLLTQNNSQ